MGGKPSRADNGGIPEGMRGYKIPAESDNPRGRVAPEAFARYGVSFIAWKVHCFLLFSVVNYALPIDFARFDSRWIHFPMFLLTSDLHQGNPQWQT